MVGRMKMGGGVHFDWTPYNRPNNSIRHNRNLLYGFYYVASSATTPNSSAGYAPVGSIGYWASVSMPSVSYNASTGVLTVSPGSLTAYYKNLGTGQTKTQTAVLSTIVYLIK